MKQTKITFRKDVKEEINNIILDCIVGTEWNLDKIKGEKSDEVIMYIQDFIRKYITLNKSGMFIRKVLVVLMKDIAIKLKSN